MKRFLLICLILFTAGSLVAQTPTVADLTTTSGSNIKWYAASTGGSALATSTVLVNSTTYYASQTVNGVESTARLAVTATVNSRPIPTFTVQPGATAYTGVAVTYTTQSGKSSYMWTFPGTLTTDYTITSGGGNTNSVTLKYVTTGSKTVTINYTANGCTAASATSSTATTVSSAFNIAIGDEYQGGKLAYVAVPGDRYYVAGQTHGLIAATADQTTISGIEWITGGSTQSTTVAGTINNYGYGQDNTNLMMGAAGYTGGAAKLCNDYSSGGYSDWFLPSYNELLKLYQSKSTLGLGGGAYWCSTEYASNVESAINVNMNMGELQADAKSAPKYVRAVRYF